MKADTSARGSRNALLVCCGAHIIQDGLVAVQYVFLPILAQSLGLNYAQVGLLRALSNSAMSLLELPSGILAERFGEKRLLMIGLLMAGVGYLCVSVSSSFGVIALCFLLTGAGAGFQHSLTSAILVKTFDASGKRRALGTYNASGDAGKLGFTGLFSLGIGMGLAWNAVIVVLSLLALVFVLLVWRLLPADKPDSPTRDRTPGNGGLASRWGIRHPKEFSLLALVVSLDSVVQSVLLTFLAFVFLEKGASAQTASFAVVLALIGGMTGKFFSGFMTARFGDYGPFVLIQVLTMVGLAGLVVLPVVPALFALPFIGLVVQGSTTVTYGVISDHVDASMQSRGFGVIYSVSGLATVAGPFVFGWMADLSGLNSVLWVLCAISGLCIPFAGFLKRDVRLASMKAAQDNEASSS